MKLMEEINIVKEIKIVNLSSSFTVGAKQISPDNNAKISGQPET